MIKRKKIHDFKTEKYFEEVMKKSKKIITKVKKRNITLERQPSDAVKKQKE